MKNSDLDKPKVRNNSTLILIGSININEINKFNNINNIYGILLYKK